MSVDPAVFAAEHWSRRPLLSRAKELPAPFDDLLSPGDVDELLAERGLREPFFRVVQSATTVGGVTRAARAGNRRITDLAHPDIVRERYAAGATLVLNALHRLHPPLVRFCGELAAELGHQVQCNAYATPGGGAQGFAFHHDTHDVLVLQVSGTKRWRVHEPVLPLPLPSQPKAGDDLVPPGAEPLLDVELEPGDALYLPRGFVHAAVTTDQPSLHLTVGLLSTTWYDVLTDLVPLAADDLAFRDALPVQPAGTLAEDLPAFLLAAARWLADLDEDVVADLVRTRLARAVVPEPVGALAQAEAVRGLTVDTAVRPRRGLAWSLTERPRQLVLHLPDRELAVPAEVGPALRDALEGPCTPGSLGLDPDDGVVLVRRLLREGALVPDRG